MKIEEVGEFLHKRVNALEAKKRVAFEKGIPRLYNLFDEELKDAQIAYELVDRLLIQMDHLNFDKIREGVVNELMEKVYFIDLKSRVKNKLKDILERRLKEWIPPK